MWKELNPTVDQLATLSTKLIGNSRQKQFYKTLHDILMAYTGTNEYITDYIATHNGPSLFENAYSSTYTTDEFKAIKHMEEVLPKIFGYRFYTFMKMGLMNLNKELGAVKYQALAFDKSLVREIMNQRRIKAISAMTFNPYKQNDFVKSFNSYLISVILFGHVTSFAVIGEGRKTLYTEAPTGILSSLAVNGRYQHHTNPLRYSTNYGADVKLFLSKYYTGGTNQDLRIKRNIIGKTAIMKGFAGFLNDAMNPNIIRTAGEQLGIDAFRDNPEIWSEKNTIYAFYQIFNRLLNPGKDSEARQDVRDPTLRLSQIYTGSHQAVDYRISDLLSRSGETLPFWQGSFGELHLTYPTLTRYFGNDFYEIQPALYYRQYNIENIIHSKDLNLQFLLTSEFRDRIQHLSRNLYDLLSQNYNNNEEIKVTFHIEKFLGLGQKTKIYNSLTDGDRQKFADLIGRNHNSMTFTIQKQDGTVVNDVEFREFVLSITFYLVMFNAFGIIGDDVSGYKLFATQRKIYNDDYITGLYSKDNLNSKLSTEGQQIYTTWLGQWNQEQGETVWNLEDCWPIYLLDDATDFITFFENTYNIRIRLLEN
ncbi:MAG: hypothetical protein ACFFCI_17065 [Promethearchaeota archaeon]